MQSSAKRYLAAALMMALAAFVVLPSPAEAQFARASLKGTVTDPEGAPLPGVTVIVRSESSGYSRQTVTALSGVYDLNGLTPGVYTVTFTLQGFRALERPGIEINVGSEGDLSVTLTLGGVEDRVVVVAQAPLVESTSKQVGGTLTQQEFEDLPSQNRSAILFAALLPGVIPSPDQQSTSSDSIFINGQDDSQNSFNIDGANNDDDVIGAIAGGQTRTAFETIQEFQVLTSQFDAEFGRATGGVINAVTKSGANDFHGTGFGYFQDDSLNEDNFFTKRQGGEEPETQFSSVGGTIGGPIIQNRAHFFGSFERNKADAGETRSFASRPDLNFATTEDNLVRNTMVRGDVQVTDDNKLSVRYLREFSPQSNQIIGNVTQRAAREEDDTDQNVIASLDSVLTDMAFNNVRFSFTREDVSFANAAFIDNGGDFAAQRAADVGESRLSFTDGNSTVAQNRVNNSFQVDDTLSWFLSDWGKGDHDLRVGVQYAYRTEKLADAGNANGTFFFDTDVPFKPGDITTFPTNFSVRTGGDTSQIRIPRNQTLGLFVQDDWQPIANLTVNLGLRWDWEEITDDQDNIAPRIGVAWDPVGDGRTVVRGGWGRFYGRFRFAAFDDFFLDGITSPSFNAPFPFDGGLDQQLLFDIAQQNGVTNLNQLRDVLAATIDANAQTPINSSPHFDDPNRTQEYADTFSVGVEREIRDGISIGVDYIHTENKNVVLETTINQFSRAAQAAGLPSRPELSVFNGQTLTGIGAIQTFTNPGNSPFAPGETAGKTYDAIQVAFRKRFGDTPIGRFGARISYTYADQSGNARGTEFTNPYFQLRTESGYNFDTGEFIGDPLALGLEDPRLDDAKPFFFRENNFVASWTYEIPGTSWSGDGGVVFSGVWRYLDGDRTEFVQIDRIDNNNRVLADAGVFNNPSPGVDADIAQTDQSFDGTLGGATNPSTNVVDMSFRYRVPINAGARNFTVTIVADFFNIFDETNFENLGSTFATESAFLIPSQAFSPRQIQLGARVNF